MASSYVDIKGPITVLTIIEIAEEHADELAQYLADDCFHLQAEVKRNNGLISVDVVRHGNTFAAWERYANSDSIERISSTRYLHFRRMKLSEHVPEEPKVLFFSSSSLPPPSDKASTKGPPEYESRGAGKRDET